MKAAGIFADPNQLFEESTGIDGMTLAPTPTPQSLGVLRGRDPKFDRFSAPNARSRPQLRGQEQDHQRLHRGLDRRSFVRRLPGAARARPGRDRQRARIALDRGLRDGGRDVNDLMRMRSQGTIFTWEKYEFFKAMKPILQAFDTPRPGTYPSGAARSSSIRSRCSTGIGRPNSTAPSATAPSRRRQPRRHAVEEVLRAGRRGRAQGQPVLQSQVLQRQRAHPLRAHPGDGLRLGLLPRSVISWPSSIR